MTEAVEYTVYVKAGERALEVDASHFELLQNTTDSDPHRGSVGYPGYSQ
ncbi:hypothetical protein [Sinorhizobium fredii]|nr:hypothetical protein [Sinorhizobium fredii]